MLVWLGYVAVSADSVIFTRKLPNSAHHSALSPRKREACGAGGASQSRAAGGGSASDIVSATDSGREEEGQQTSLVSFAFSQDAFLHESVDDGKSKNHVELCRL